MKKNTKLFGTVGCKTLVKKNEIAVEQRRY